MPQSVRLERGAAIWGPIGEEGRARLGRELNERHVERVRALEFD